MTEPAPRLRIERLVVVESRSPLKFIRPPVSLHSGLNIVWAEERPAECGATEVERAGHGVGKTTFSLMLRAVLGDDGAAVKAMRAQLAEHFVTGGIAAEVVAGRQRFAVFRSYGPQSFALENATVEGLFQENAKADALDFSGYVAALGEQACLQYMSLRTLPVTGQRIEWGHVLCWVARDQALGLRQYFEWRNDDGTGLRRKVKDPPALVQLALGLLTDAEAESEERISRIDTELSTVRGTLRREEERGANTRLIVESQLRQWAGVSNTLQMVADDLFEESVQKEIQRKTGQLEAKNDDDRAAVAALDSELIELAAEIKRQDRDVRLARSRWDETVALRTQDKEALKEILEWRDKLLTLSGTCQYGGVAYGICQHIQEQRDTVKLTARRDVGVLSRMVDDRGDREAAEKADYEREAKKLAELAKAQENKTSLRAKLNNAIEGRLRQLGQRDAVCATLTQWQESYQEPETEKLREARTAVLDLEKELDGAKSARLMAQRQVSDRERQVSARITKLAKVFGVTGRYVPADEKRPFQMLGADGDAYTVLEILLGDLACAADGASGGGAHPGLLIFDCPREREMSPGLYDRFLTLVDEVCREAPGLQVIITTTTPPPPPLGEPPTRILKLSRASDEDLLLRCRIQDLLSRGAQASDEERP